MCAEGALDLLAIDQFGSGPALGRRQHDHGPARTYALTAAARVVLDRPNLLDHCIERCGHRLMHQSRIVAFDVVRCPTIAAQ